MTLPQLPTPEETTIHVTQNGKSLGPWNGTTIATKYAAGELTANDSFWFAPMKEWAILGSNPEFLAFYSGAVPPVSPGPPTPPPAPSGQEDDHLDAVFGSLIEKSWDHMEKHDFATRIDEVFLGAVITSTLDEGYSLIDLTSDGTHHYLRFENMQDHSRIIFKLNHLTGDLVSSEVLGHHAGVLIGYGEKVANISTVISALKAEFKSGFIRNTEPGSITVDGDIASGYVYCQVDMFWSIDEIIDSNFDVKYEKLSENIRASTHALRKYLRGRFQ